MNLKTLARETLGFQKLRPGQLEAIRAVLAGQDTLAILPTGGGKSAIYQLAGMQLDGPTIVVSPLLALQRDQLESMESMGIGNAALLNSTLSAEERSATLAAFANNECQFLLLAPEQFSRPDTLPGLLAANPGLFVVDEAHCISQWGPDFRPDYLHLHRVVEALGRPTVLALTATAAPPVREEIVERLGMRNPRIVVAGFDRPNLHFSVRRFENTESKTTALIEAVLDGPKPAIVYTATRAATEELAAALESGGTRAVAYHAGLPKADREARQLAFMSGTTDVIVATVAFGLGIDKADVRCVWHHTVSDSLDSYYQEAGRAGRDGQDGAATLFYTPADLTLRRFQNSGGRFDARNAARIAAVMADLAGKERESEEDRGVVELADLKDQVNLPAARVARAIAQLEDAGMVQVNASGEVIPHDNLDFARLETEVDVARERQRTWEKSRLEMMRLYAEETCCRRQFLLAYFGEELTDACGNCDNCEKALRKLDPAFTMPPGNATPRPFPVGARVRHNAWGEGQILRYDGDKLTAVFDTAGYKTLAVALVISNRLLAAVN